MHMRLTLLVLLAIGALTMNARPAAAQQTLNFSLGYFAVRGEDARVEGDVLNANRGIFVFDIDDFNGATVGGEWLVPLGEYFEAGAGISFSRRTVPSVFSEFVNADGSEIEQEFRLRLLPVAFTARVLPLRQTSPVQPYFGGGLALVAWRYSESGDFVDFQRQNAIFPGRFVDSGTQPGAVLLGGIRFAGDSISGGFEVRYLTADAPLERPFSILETNPRIDLGGWTYAGTVGWRFAR